jgi:hypothetical protein
MAQSLKGPVKGITQEDIDDMLATSSDDEAPPLAESKAAAQPGKKKKKKRRGRTARKRIAKKKKEQREAQRYQKEMFAKQDETQSLLSSLSPEELQRIGLGNLGLAHTIIQDDYTGESRSTKPGMSYSAPLSHKEGLPIGWHHHTSRSQHRGLSYWKGPVTYIDPNIGKYYPQTIDRTIWDYPSKQRLAEEAKYLNLSRKPYKTDKNSREIKKLQRKWQSRLSDKIDQHQRDLEGESHIVTDEIKEYPKTIRVFGDDKRGYHQEMLKPIDKRSKQVTGHIEEGGKSFFEEGKAEPHQPQPSAIFTDSGADGTTKKIMKRELRVGGKTKKRRRKKKRKTRRKKKTKRRRKKKTRKKTGGKTTILGFPIPIFDLWQTKVKVNNTRKEVKQWKEFIEKKTKGGRLKKRTMRR